MVYWALGFSTANQHTREEHLPHDVKAHFVISAAQCLGHHFRVEMAAVQVGFQVHSFLVSSQFKVKLSCEMVQQ